VIRHGVLPTETAFIQQIFTPNALDNEIREILDKPGDTLNGEWVRGKGEEPLDKQYPKPNTQ
jgi:hypothetical protein